MNYLSKLVLLIAIVIPIHSYAAELGEEVSREIRKSYALEGTEIIEIKNKYGKVEILSWEKNEAQLSVLITAKATHTEKAQQRLEQVDIRERWLGSKIQLETRLLNTSFKIGKLSGITVSYTLYLPTHVPLEIEQNSGNISLASRKGNVDIQLGNGHLEANELLGEGNNLQLEFSDADIAFMQGGDVQFAFGKLRIKEAGDIFLKTNTARVELGRVNNLQIFANLGEIRIDEVENLAGDYTSTKFVVGKLIRTVDLEAKYATAFEIEEVSAEFEHVDVRTTFVSVDLTFASEALFELEAETKKGNMLAKDLNLEIVASTNENNRTQYQAAPTLTARTDQTVGKVNIKARHGKVKLSRSS